MKNLRTLVFLLILALGVSPAGARPLCSVIFAHDFAVDQYADVRHSGALDIFKDLDRKWTFKAKRLPKMESDLSSRPTELPLSEIRFMQNHISNNYSDGRFTVVQNARNIRDGLLDPASLPPIQVWKDEAGKIWTLDHRRLAAMILSGKVDSTRVQWALRDDVIRQSYKMSTLVDGDLLILSDKKSQAIVVRRPYAKLSQGQVRVIAKSEVPTYFKNIAPAQMTQTSAVQVDVPPSRLPSKDILFSETFGASNKVQDIFQKLQREEIKLEDLSDLRIWQDSSGRKWTADNEVLAAVRMWNPQAVIKVRILSPQEVASMRRQVESQTGGHALIVPLANADQAYLIQ